MTVTELKEATINLFSKVDLAFRSPNLQSTINHRNDHRLSKEDALPSY